MKSKAELIRTIEKAFETRNAKRQMRLVGTALSRLLENQTSDEVEMETTRDANGIGFTGAEGEIGTSMAKFYLNRGFLTPKQVAYWMKPSGKTGRPRILKYRGQLAEFAKRKQRRQKSLA